MASDYSAPEPTTRISEVRRSRRVTQAEPAEKTGLSISTIERLDRGEIENPSIRALLAIAKALDCRLEELVEPDWRHSPRSG